MTLQAYQRSFNLRSRRKPSSRFTPDEWNKKNKGPLEDEDEHESEDEPEPKPEPEDEVEAEEEEVIPPPRPRKKTTARRKNANPAPNTPLRRLRSQDGPSPRKTRGRK